LARHAAHPDEGTVHRSGDVMVERGPGFEERWVLISNRGDEVGLAEFRPPGGDVTARLVRIGSTALAVWAGTSAGGAQFLAAQDWDLGRFLGKPDPKMEIERVVRNMVGQLPLPDGWIALDPEQR